MPVLRPWLRKRWVLVGVAAALALVLAVGAVFVFASTRDGNPPRPAKKATGEFGSATV
jgi:hypothetical protein